MCRQKQTDQPPSHSKEVKKKSTHTAAKPIDNVDSFTALYVVGDKTVKPFTVDVLLNGKPFSMELDTGATVSIISNATFQQVFPNVDLQPSSVKLHAYPGESISVLGQLKVNVTYGNQQAKLPLVVVSGNGPSLFGRDWMLKFS